MTKVRQNITGSSLSKTTHLASFSFNRLPEIHYGAGITRGLIDTLPADLRETLWITGGKPSHFSVYFEKFLNLSGIKIPVSQIIQIGPEPSPQIIDGITDTFREKGIKKVIAIGGGSVVDAGKAISAMLVTDITLLDHLEGVGKGVPLSGHKVPFIAIPTTSGTGSEMTSNAVFSEVGQKGYKKSIRHKSLVPDEIWIDPILMTTCTPQQTIYSGLDAFTQLLEPYLSTQANLITDTLAEKGLQLIVDNLERAFGEGCKDLDVRGSMALAAAFSGICLANAGLGIVHGLAGPLGGFFDIPHGVACAGLLAKANEVNQIALQERGEVEFIHKMAQVGRMFAKPHESGNEPVTGQKSDDLFYCQKLTENLLRWEQTFTLPKFSAYGITEDDLPKIVTASSNRNNPVVLNNSEIEIILRHCL